jgi:hypothetical protein
MVEVLALVDDEGVDSPRTVRPPLELPLPRGILFFGPFYLVSLRFALVYFGITFLPLFTLGTT